MATDSAIPKLDLKPKSNIANKVRNTSLPKTKPLLPVYEAVSNAIHAISEASKLQPIAGRIIINLIRNGNADHLRELTNVDIYPIRSIEVIDNGIGFNNENMTYFIEAYTDHKIEIGGKGVGRFVCLKAFKFLSVASTYEYDGDLYSREFEYRNTREGIHNFDEKPAGEFQERMTKITLNDYKDEYQKFVPMDIMQFSRDLVNHFLLYFIQESIPDIVVRNQNNIEAIVKIFTIRSSNKRSNQVILRSLPMNLRFTLPKTTKH